MIKSNCEKKKMAVRLPTWRRKGFDEYPAELNFYAKGELRNLRLFFEACEEINKQFVDGWEQRRLNYTEYSEVMIASHFNWGICKRIARGGKNTFDLYDPINHERIELKASWLAKGSPISMRSKGSAWELWEKWDKLVHVDCSDVLNGGAKIYHIPNEVLDRTHVGHGQTFRDCRLEAKERILVNLQKVVDENRIKPFDICKLPA